MHESPPRELAAALADRYELGRAVGQGGMAVVYRAHDRRHQRDVAIKMLRPGLVAQAAAERFLKEIRVAARLTHPHILALYDSGEAAGFLYYVMPYLGEPSLRERLRAAGRLAKPEALAIAAPVADALTYAHRMGVLHRDVKPENILFAEGHPIVADFGIAKAIGGTATGTGFTLGTPGYMSPEQAAGLQELDARTDVYSLAAVIHEMLVGEAPRPGSWPTDEAVRAGRFRDAPPEIRSRWAELGRDVEAAVVRGLALRPDQRPETPLALVREVDDGGARRHYHSTEVQAIVRRATELEAAQPSAGELMTLGGIEALGAEVGLAPELVRAAAQPLAALGPAPRALAGTVADRYRQVAFSPWRLMDPTTPPGEPWGVTDLLGVIFFSVLTAGVLPLVFVGISRSRKRRLRRFFTSGTPATAQIIDFRAEAVGFDVKLTRVRYEFPAGGALRRGSDLTLPVIADRWRAGERIEILYLADYNYDSVIATTEAWAKAPSQY